MSARLSDDAFLKKKESPSARTADGPSSEFEPYSFSQSSRLNLSHSAMALLSFRACERNALRPEWGAGRRALVPHVKFPRNPSL
jgi:hypothetical protein